MTPAGLTVLLAVEPVDMRRSFAGLGRWVRERLGQEPEGANVMFVFVNRRKDMVKALWRDSTGWCLLAKRLDEREVTFPCDIPEGAASVAIDAKGLVALLDGAERARPRQETGRSVARAARKAAEAEMSSGVTKTGRTSIAA
jgi:transposase